MAGSTDKALALLRKLPRVQMTNIRPIPGQRYKVTRAVKIQAML